MANIKTRIPALKLSDGASVPMLGFGTGTAWYKTGDEDKVDRALIDTIKNAIKLEYYHLDGAEMYKTEKELGTAIQESKVDREKLFVTTKVYTNIGDIRNAIDVSLKKLQLDYVDLYLIHAPFFAQGEEDLQKAWAAMEDVKKSGKAKSIGVSNFLIPHLETILKNATIKPVLNQIEFHPYLQHGPLLEFHKKHNIATAAYGPLSAVTKAKPGPIDEFVASLAKKYAVSDGEVALRWCIDQDVIPVTTTGKEQRMSDYLRAATFKLTPVEIERISELGKQKHFRGFFTKQFSEDDRS